MQEKVDGEEVGKYSLIMINSLPQITPPKICSTVHGKTSAGEYFHGFSLSRECFPVNHDLANQQYKGISTAKVLL